MSALVRKGGAIHGGHVGHGAGNSSSQVKR